MRLRDVDPGDIDLYVRMRCDPAMMAELGGPLPRDSIDEKVRADARAAASGEGWLLVIQPDDSAPSVLAGTVLVWAHDEGGAPMSEIGWMVLPEFQGRGLAKAAVRTVLRRARDERRWGEIHAFPGVTNAPSNGICRSLGFRLVGQQRVTFADRTLPANHWVIDPATVPG